MLGVAVGVGVAGGRRGGVRGWEVEDVNVRVAMVGIMEWWDEDIGLIGFRFGRSSGNDIWVYGIQCCIIMSKVD